VLFPLIRLVLKTSISWCTVIVTGKQIESTILNNLGNDPGNDAGPRIAASTDAGNPVTYAVGNDPGTAPSAYANTACHSAYGPTSASTAN